MAGLLYYLPGRDQVQLDQLAEHGLAYTCERDCTHRATDRGPDGGPGMVFADTSHVPFAQLGYWRDKQEWLKFPGHPSGAWVGFGREHRPAPKDLAREEQLPGHEVRLADGQEWLVPVARGFTENDGELRWYIALPQKTTIDAEGNWMQGDVVACYARLWEIATTWWDTFHVETTPEGVTIRFDFAGSNDAAALVLAANYRLAKVEIALLGLFNARSPATVLNALVDWPTMETWLKKKQATPAGPVN